MLFFITIMFSSDSGLNPIQIVPTQINYEYKKEAHKCMGLQLYIYKRFMEMYDKACKRDLKVQESLNLLYNRIKKSIEQKESFKEDYKEFIETWNNELQKYVPMVEIFTQSEEMRFLKLEGYNDIEETDYYKVLKDFRVIFHDFKGLIFHIQKLKHDSDRPEIAKFARSMVDFGRPEGINLNMDTKYGGFKYPEIYKYAEGQRVKALSNLIESYGILNQHYSELNAELSSLSVRECAT